RTFARQRVGLTGREDDRVGAVRVQVRRHHRLAERAIGYFTAVRRRIVRAGDNERIGRCHLRDEEAQDEQEREAHSGRGRGRGRGMWWIVGGNRDRGRDPALIWHLRKPVTDLITCRPPTR